MKFMAIYITTIHFKVISVIEYYAACGGGNRDNSDTKKQLLHLELVPLVKKIKSYLLNIVAVCRKLKVVRIKTHSF